MKLNTYLNEIKKKTILIHNNKDIEISSITNDSRKVKSGTLFVAINGVKFDGHNFIDDALSSGAAAVVCSNLPDKLDDNVVYIQVADTYDVYALLAEVYFQFPGRKLKIIGITGTNGKTTCAFLVNHMLQQGGKKCGLITTVQYSYGGIVIPATRTTPEAFELQKLFSEMEKAGCEYVVMEVSSHSLSQSRLGNSKMTAVLFTNISGDHLDYHGDMDSYYLAKKQLFTNYCENSKTIRVINSDDLYGKRLISEVSGNVVTYGLNLNCNCRILTNSCGSITGIRLDDDTMFDVKTSLIGGFNAYNIAGAITVCLGLGVPIKIIIKALETFENVPGRLELVEVSSGAACYVDYAHTDDALRRVLSALKKLNPRQLIVVFGCGGDRDRSKRPRMGEAVFEFADLVVITSDNPRTEDPIQIINDIISTLNLNKEYKIIPDRKEAIEFAVKTAVGGDIVLVAGKGHEDYQEIGTGKISFDDREVIKNIDRELSCDENEKM